MSKMSELSQVLDELISCGERMIQIADSLKDLVACGDRMIGIAKDIKEIFTEDDSPKLPAKTTKAAKTAKDTAPEPVKDEAPAKTYTKEEVRGVLSAKANAENGKFKAAVKDIVKKYGNGGSLTNVDVKDYAALVADVEALA